MSYDILPKAKLQYLLTRLKEVFDGMVQGHTIKNNTGTSMTTRTSVQFGGYLKTTDDATNDRTIIDDSPIEITWNAYQALTDVQRANNKYLITDYPSSGIEITDVGVPTGASEGQVPIVSSIGGNLVFTMGTPSSGGLLPHLTIEADPNTTVTVAKGGTTIVATETSSGIYDCDVDSYGTWVISSVRSGESATLNLNVDTVKSYYIDSSYYFLATITVAFSEGETVVCTDNDPISPTEYTATESPYTFEFHEEGTWYIKVTANSITRTEATDVIEQNGDTFTHNLVWDKTTLVGIKRILNYKLQTTLLQIGDEVNVTQDGSAWTMQIAHFNAYATDDVLFVSKTCPNVTYAPGRNNYASRTNVINFLSTWYNNLVQADKECIAVRDVWYVYDHNGHTTHITQYVWIPSRYEVFGNGSAAGNNKHFSIFQTSSQRIRKNVSGSTVSWMLTTNDTAYASDAYCDYVTTGGGLGEYTASAINLLPCFEVTADS